MDEYQNQNPTLGMSELVDDKGALEIADIYMVHQECDIYIQHKIAEPVYSNLLIEAWPYLEPDNVVEENVEEDVNGVGDNVVAENVDEDVNGVGGNVVEDNVEEDVNGVGDNVVADNVEEDVNGVGDNVVADNVDEDVNGVGGEVPDEISSAYDSDDENYGS
ncbi:uncharacterized protein LOC131624418 [Vicia villosa]|uniref:uncharacterized protein LOC131624418 n=1 Tax=Vicia villosa TaxID=3911 RepID=UPI00273B9A5A|nr:uncharacterized protein LOC131624418 [Vicia villosa]